MLKSQLVYLDGKSFFDLDYNFYITNSLTDGYDYFEEYGKCNNKCIFCCDSGFLKNKNIPPALCSEKSGGNTNHRIMLGYGEPTRLDNLIEKIKYLKLKYAVVSLTTNGRQMYDFKFVRDLVRAGLNEVIFSLHGYYPQMHDYITRIRGSFVETIKGIRNVIKNNKENNLKIAISYLLTQKNVFSLYEAIQFMIRLGINTICLKTALPLGDAKKIYKKIMPTYSTILSEYNKLKTKCCKNNRLRKLRVFLLHIPFCITNNSGNHLYLLGETVEFKHIINSSVNDYICKNCYFKPYCIGIFRDYVEVHGLNEFGVYAKDNMMRR